MVNRPPSVGKAALQIAYMWQRLADEAKGDPWYKHEARQAYRDSLQALKNCDLIYDFSIHPPQVVVQGKTWTITDLRYEP